MNIKEMQDKLNECHQLNRQFDYNIDLIKLEEKYQKYISKFSPAYLSGNPWYVGPSIIKYIERQPINTDCLALLFFVSNKLN